MIRLNGMYYRIVGISQNTMYLICIKMAMQLCISTVFRFLICIWYFISPRQFKLLKTKIQCLYYLDLDLIFLSLSLSLRHHFVTHLSHQCHKVTFYSLLSISISFSFSISISPLLSCNDGVTLVLHCNAFLSLDFLTLAALAPSEPTIFPHCVKYNSPVSISTSYLSLFLSLSLSDTFGQHPDIVRFYFLWRRGVNLLLSISFLHSFILSFLLVFSCCSVVVHLLFKLLFTWLVFIPINHRNKPIFIRCLLFNLMFIFERF